MTKKMTIDIDTGALLLDDTVVAPVSLSAVRMVLASTGIAVDELHPNQGFTTFGFEGKLADEPFGVNIAYSNDKLEAVWLAWDGGITKSKGYSTSTKELTSDKNKLTEILARALQKSPDARTETYSSFKYNWGEISVSASLASVIVAVGMRWNS